MRSYGLRKAAQLETSAIAGRSDTAANAYESPAKRGFRFSAQRRVNTTLPVSTRTSTRSCGANPASVNNNPISNTDPSGMTSLADLSAANQALGSLMRTTFSVINYIDRVKSAVSVLQTFAHIGSILANPATYTEALNFLGSSDSKFVTLIKSDIGDAVTKFRNNSAKLFAITTRYYSRDILGTLAGDKGGRERGFLIFLPTPTVIAGKVKFDFYMGQMNVSKRRVPIKGRVGGPAKHTGRVVGLGSYTGVDKYTQYFRMDYDASHGHHGANTPRVWTDGKFHFHTE